MTQSTRYAIAQLLHATVAGVATAEGAEAINNPKLPIDTRNRAPKLLFTLDRGDKLLEQPGQREKRRCRVVLGALAVTSAADADVDALHFAARDALRTIRPALMALNGHLMREVEIEPELKDLATDGAQLLSAYEIDYLETYPAA
jgi:hypothetical protein